MRIFKSIIMVALVSLSFLSQARQETITILTLNGVGSQGDTAARFFAPLLEKELKRPVIVVNAPGASGSIGMRQFSQLSKDCSSIMVGSSALAYVSKMPIKLDFNPMEDFTPIHGFASGTTMVIVNADSPIYSIDDLVKYYKANQRLKGGSATPMTEMTLKLFDETIDVKTDIINYKALPQLSLDLAAGLIDYTFSLSGNSGIQGLIDSKKLRVIATLSKTRSKNYPATPTLMELGYPYIEDFAWGGLFIKSEETLECRTVLTNAFSKVINSEEGKKFEELSGAPKLFNVSGQIVRQTQLRELKVISRLIKN